MIVWCGREREEGEVVFVFGKGFREREKRWIVSSGEVFGFWSGVRGKEEGRWGRGGWCLKEGVSA